MKTHAAITVLLALLVVSACGDREEAGGARSARRTAAEAQADDLTVTASVDATTVDIGDRVRFRVEVRYRDGVEVEWPAILDGLDHQMVYETGEWRDGEPIGSFKVRSLETVLDPGIGPVLDLAPIHLRWRRRGEDRWQVAETEAIAVEVTSVAEGAPEFEEPLDYFELPAPAAADRVIERGLLWYVVGGAALLFLLLWLILFRRRRAARIVPPTPEELALAELDRLAELGLLEPDRVRELYYRLAAVLRRYVEGRFGLEAPEQTTEEFLASLRGGAGGLPVDRRQALEGFMGVADLVRYARHQPPAAEVRGAVDLLRDFVESSRPLAIEDEKEVARAL